MARYLVATAILCGGVTLTGCRNLRSPQPPLPGLPQPLKDLAAIRAGNQIWLSWTMPEKPARKLANNGQVTVHVCRREGMAGACANVGEPVLLAPGATGSFAEALPASLTSGTPRVLDYFVELVNRNGRVAGLSNGVATLAGAPPSPVRGLTAERRDNGVLLRWSTLPAWQDPATAAVRLLRFRMVLDAANNSRSSPAPLIEPAQKSWFVRGGSRLGQTLDTDIRERGEYEYRAQRVFQVTVGRQTLEVAGELSPPARSSAPPPPN